LRGSRQFFDTENTDRVFLRYRYGKYREIPTDTDRKIPTRYTTLNKTDSIFVRVSKNWLLFVRRLSVFWGVLVHRKIKSPARKKILAGRLGLDPLP